ncbi:MAG: DUF3187 family protein [Rhodospirillales bacterium]|nr:DUF3187 family protein [Rhodospirillales bacterium]
MSVFWPGTAEAEEGNGHSIATPLRIVNLNPFHMLYGVPGSFGTPVLTPGSTELIASMSIASHSRGGVSGQEVVAIDGETHRQALSLRHGFGNGWEYLLDLSFVSHRPGSLDSFIEEWHRTFGLSQGDRLITPHDRLTLIYVDSGTTHVDIDSRVSSVGDVSLGVGYALPSPPFSNDGMAVRAMVKLPTGNEDRLAGSGGFSVSGWAETSGVLFGSAASREWLYGATLGVLVGEAPPNLSGIGGRFIAFGRFGVTWQLTPRFNLTTQVDVHSSPYGASAVSPLSDPVVMIGLGGAWRFSEDMTLEIAVTEDDGTFHAAPDTGLHVALRWRL